MGKQKAALPLPGPSDSEGHNLGSEPNVPPTPTRSYHVFWQLVSREIFHIFVVIVDDVCQLPPVNGFLKHPHLDRGGKLLQVLYIISNDFCNS